METTETLPPLDYIFDIHYYDDVKRERVIDQNFAAEDVLGQVERLLDDNAISDITIYRRKIL